MTTIFKLAACTAFITAVPAGSPNGRVTDAANMGVARASHTSTLLPDGNVLIAGGFAGSGHEYRPFASTEIYDARTGRFATGPSMRAGRSGHTATRLADGRVLLAGGWSASNDARGTADVFDPASRRMIATGPMLVPRAGQTATLLRDGRVLFVGGVDKSETKLSSAEIYDPRTGAFTATGSMSIPRESHTATMLADGRVAIVGGSSGRYPSATIHRSIEIYDPSAGTFSVASQLLVARHKHAAISLADGRLVVVGGSDNRDWNGQLETAEVFDPSSGRSVATGPMHGKRFKIDRAVALLRDGRVLIAGAGSEAELYDPRNNEFGTVPGSLGDARYYAATTTLSDGRVLITGGYARQRGQLPSTAVARMFVP